MTEKKPAGNPELLQAAAEAERTLVAEEERAERRFRRAQERLAAAEARLERETHRAERRRDQFAKAEAELRRSQEARAAGPQEQ
ncbi:MAG: hypothetical protein ACRDJH_15280 [Thermomicrobiales bacterium]